MYYPRMQSSDDCSIDVHQRTSSRWVIKTTNPVQAGPGQDSNWIHAQFVSQALLAGAAHPT
jgi:hypothetical protein